jgi:hypothetical protein
VLQPLAIRELPRQFRSKGVVAFSCKRRGVCPSCNARRAHDTAIHLVERALPRVPLPRSTAARIMCGDGDRRTGY